MRASLRKSLQHLALETRQSEILIIYENPYNQAMRVMHYIEDSRISARRNFLQECSREAAFSRRDVLLLRPF